MWKRIHLHLHDLLREDYSYLFDVYLTQVWIFFFSLSSHYDVDFSRLSCSPYTCPEMWGKMGENSNVFLLDSVLTLQEKQSSVINVHSRPGVIQKEEPSFLFLFFFISFFVVSSLRGQNANWKLNTNCLRWSNINRYWRRNVTLLLVANLNV